MKINYIAQKCTNKGVLYGKSHASNNTTTTLCGIDIAKDFKNEWCLIDSKFEGVVTCIGCSKIIGKNI